MKNKIIYLTGFMGAGKSTIGPILANTMGWEFYDLDKVIEEIIGEKVRTIFDEKGEKYFREMEEKTLRELSKGKELVISLGGGTIANDINFNILKNTGCIVYLKSSPESMYERLKFKRDRPSLINSENENQTKEELMQRIMQIFNERKKYYEQADIIIDTDKTTVGLTVDKIVKIISKQMDDNKS